MFSSDTSEPKKVRAISARSLRAKTDTGLERIVRKNLHDAAMLGAVHVALKRRSRKKAVALRREIRELLALDRVTGAPMRDVIIWTRAPLPRRKPWYRTWPYVLMMLGFVGVGALYGAEFRLWPNLHQGLLSLGEQFQLF